MLKTHQRAAHFDFGNRTVPGCHTNVSGLRIAQSGLRVHISIHESNGDYTHYGINDYYVRPKTGEKLRTVVEILRTSLFGKSIPTGSSADKESTIIVLEDRIRMQGISLVNGQFNWHEYVRSVYENFTAKTGLDVEHHNVLVFSMFTILST